MKTLAVKRAITAVLDRAPSPAASKTAKPSSSTHDTQVDEKVEFSTSGLDAVRTPQRGERHCLT
jgi:hypothetical protein